eukprot:7391483-Prymnesium_polylepis.2
MAQSCPRRGESGRPVARRLEKGAARVWVTRHPWAKMGRTGVAHSRARNRWHEGGAREVRGERGRAHNRTDSLATVVPDGADDQRKEHQLQREVAEHADLSVALLEDVQLELRGVHPHVEGRLVVCHDRTDRLGRILCHLGRGVRLRFVHQRHVPQEPEGRSPHPLIPRRLVEPLRHVPHLRLQLDHLQHRLRQHGRFIRVVHFQHGGP